MNEKQVKTVFAIPTQEISDMPDAARGRLLSVLQVQSLTAEKACFGQGTALVHKMAALVLSITILRIYKD